MVKLLAQYCASNLDLLEGRVILLLVAVLKYTFGHKNSFVYVKHLAGLLDIQHTFF